jgi:hypothetical protein
MTTFSLPTLPSFATTPNGSKIPARESIAWNPAVGFGVVVTRSGSRVRIAVDAPANLEVTARLERISEASLNAACIEIAGLEARRDGLCPETGLGVADRLQDPFIGATALVKQLSASVEARIREPNEMIINIDDAERFGWEFDEYARLPVLKKVLKEKAPKPAVTQVTEVVELEDASRPDWLVAEMNACYGDNWIPRADAKA